MRWLLGLMIGACLSACSEPVEQPSRPDTAITFANTDAPPVCHADSITTQDVPRCENDSDCEPCGPQWQCWSDKVCRPGEDLQRSLPDDLPQGSASLVPKNTNSGQLYRCYADTQCTNPIEHQINSVEACSQANGLAWLERTICLPIRNQGS